MKFVLFNLEVNAMGTVWNYKQEQIVAVEKKFQSIV